jgi:hypothetical protein
MSDSYWVQVDHADGSTDRWEHLTQAQANHIYSEQVEIYGRVITTTGRM